MRELRPALGWSWRPATFMAADRGGLGIVHLVDNHYCPVDRRDEDDAVCRHRLQQLKENLLGLR
jgi:hypothetical protein